jgi:hypothetical protein
LDPEHREKVVTNLASLIYLALVSLTYFPGVVNPLFMSTILALVLQNLGSDYTGKDRETNEQ